MAIWLLSAVATCVKMLFIPAYRSTDFEVHRNWLAITHSQPLQKWYLEDTSEWTLDYPPLFAWFEYILSIFASFVDPSMLHVTNLNYASDDTVLFQRMSVIVTDFVYYYAVKEFHSSSGKILGMKSSTQSDVDQLLIPILLIFNIGLFIVDHIHFQYNGILFGIMLLSVTRIIQGRYKEGAFWFAVLLNMKHIFIYVAPAWFIYLLRTYCFPGDGRGVTSVRFSFSNFMSLASIVGLVFCFSFGPFIYMRQVSQVLSRLFPFKRGLVHAYWAPNFWAVYSSVDKFITMIGLHMGVVNQSRVIEASMTGGLVQEYSHVILPSIGPTATLVLVLLAMVVIDPTLTRMGHIMHRAAILCSKGEKWPSIYILWEQHTEKAFVRAIVLCAFSSFMFGWHVHEKAILMIIIPMTLLVMVSKQDARLYLIMATTGFYSLFPLLFTPFENILKVLLLILSSIFSFLCLGTFYRYEDNESMSFSLRNIHIELLKPLQLPVLNLTESLYIIGFVPLGLFNSLGFWLLGLSTRLPFLPLMLTSLYCAVGVIYCYVEFYHLSVQMSPPKQHSEQEARHRRRRI